MFEAQLLIRPSSDLVLMSPWMNRQQDNAIVTAEVLAIMGATLTVEVLTKKKEDAGDGSPVGPSIVITSVKRDFDEFVGVLEDQVRYRYTVSGSTGDWVLFRMLSPVWFDSVVP